MATNEELINEIDDWEQEVKADNLPYIMEQIKGLMLKARADTAKEILARIDKIMKENEYINNDYLAIKGDELYFELRMLKKKYEED